MIMKAVFLKGNVAGVEQLYTDVGLVTSLQSWAH